MMEKTSRFSITDLSANDFLEMEELFGSLRYPEVQKTAEVALRELFSFLKFLSAPVLRCITDKCFLVCRFPHNEGKVYEWFDHPRSGGTRNTVLKAINVTKKEGTCWQDINLFNTVKLNELNLLDDDAFEVFYHGTSHERADNILLQGIDLEKGKKKLDFSNNCGFYVSKELCLGRKFAAFHYGENDSAVLVFRVKRVELRGDNNNNGLDLTGVDKMKEWQDLVKAFISGKPSRKFLKELKGYDFIEGSMVAKGKNDFEHYPKPKSDSYQLCVRKYNCASLFDRSLCAVVYFSS